MFQLQEQIEQLVGKNDARLENICFAPMSTGTEKPTVSQCVVQSIYGYFGNSKIKFQNSTTDDKGNVKNYLNELDRCMT